MIRAVDTDRVAISQEDVHDTIRELQARGLVVAVVTGATVRWQLTHNGRRALEDASAFSPTEGHPE